MAQPFWLGDGICTSMHRSSQPAPFSCYTMDFHQSRTPSELRSMNTLEDESGSPRVDADTVTLYDHEQKPGQDRGIHACKPRSRMHCLSFWQLFLDIILAAAAASFFAFACVVSTHRGQPARDPLPASLMSAATYVSESPTLVRKHSNEH